MAERVTFALGDKADENVFEPDLRPGARMIRWGSRGDEEQGRRGSMPRVFRTASNTSQMSTASARGRRYSIDPATALPITYRTVSFAIEASKEKDRVEAVKVKHDAAAELGELEWHTLSVNEVETRLSTSLIHGLSKEQVELKAKEHGKNMPSKPPSDLFSRIFGYLFGGFGSILLIGGILVKITYEPLGKPNLQVAATLHLPLSERKIAGDATDQAVLRLSESLGPVRDLDLSWMKTFELAFNSKNKFMIRTLALAHTDGLALSLSPAEAKLWTSDDLLLTIKGAPDIIVERCTSYVGEDGDVYPFDDKMKTTVEDIKDKWSSNGKRVILLARKILPGHQAVHSPEHNIFETEVMREANSDLTLVGLIGIVDPPRDEILDVVKTLRRAGIRIFMVTGDFKLTARAIAIECGIITNPPSMVHDMSMLSRNPVVPKTICPDVIEKDLALAEGPVRSITLSGPELKTLNDIQWDQL
jgi:magnesium-transporting ATPase (P-type)